MSKKTQHTPGPWEIAAPTMAGSSRIVIEAYGFGSIAAISLNGAPRAQSQLSDESPYYQQQLPTMEANARLITAAPDLLEACEDLLLLMAKYGLSDWDIPIGDVAQIHAAREAVARAKGE